MSGIAGIFNSKGEPVDHLLLQRMTAYMAFRGPEAQDTFVGSNVGLGHTLLSTTFESRDEQQPANLFEKLWITADAILYGRGELINKLKGGDSGVRDDATDTELILHAYERWNVNCLEHLNGDFSFAIWDDGKLFCARDQLGVKPFYYAVVDGNIVFSNTLDCLRLHPSVTSSLNDAALGDFLLFGFNQNLTTTTFADIKRLPPAHYLVSTPAGTIVRRYWTLKAGEPIRYRRDEDYLEHFKYLLEEAVGDRMRTDSLYVQMSGGVDSTTIAALAHEALRKRSVEDGLRALTIIYEKAFDDPERHYSREAAHALNISQDIVVGDNYSPFERWEQAELRTPEPMNNYLHTMIVEMHKGLSGKTRVLLGGLGGDSLFRIRLRAYLVECLKKREWQRLATEFAPYVLLFWRRPPMPFGASLKLRLGLMKPPEPDPFPEWINADFQSAFRLRERWVEVKEESYSTDPIRFSTYDSLLSNLWPYNFETLDPGATRFPIEYRYPLFDLRLINFALSIPPVPFCMDKMLLRNSTRGLLPESIRLRRKTHLQGDPVFNYLGRETSVWVDCFEPVPELKRLVDCHKIPPVGGWGSRNVDLTDARRYYLHMRPRALNYWLQHWSASNRITAQEDEVTYDSKARSRSNRQEILSLTLS